MKISFEKAVIGYFCSMQTEMRLTVNRGGYTAFSFLQGRLTNISQKQLSVLFHKQQIRVNGEFAQQEQTLEAGDELQLWIQPKNEVEAVVLPLDVVFEDADLLVVNKPSGMPMHPGLGNYNNSLLHALKHYYLQKDEHTSLVKEALVHRIDKDTSGLVVLAKNRTALHNLNQQFATATTERRYQAFIWGQPTPAKGQIDLPTGRIPNHPYQFGVCTDGSFGKPALSEYEVLANLGAYSWVQLLPVTGRTHQLRLHMQHIGHGIVGDKRYLQKNTPFQDPFGRLALHAAYLGFNHPVTGAFIDFQLPFPLPVQEAVEFA